MTHDPQNPDEDVFDPGFEDDIDADVEAIEDFPAEDWDENFDEGTESEPAPVRRRGLFSSKILLALIALVVIGGGLFMFMGMGGQTGTQEGESAMPAATEESIQVDELANAGDLPPMPAPIDADGTTDSADVTVIEDPALNVPKVPAIPPDRKLSEVDVTSPAPATDMALTPEPATPAPTPDLTAALAEKDRETAEKLAALEKSWQERFAAMEADLKQKAEVAEARVKTTESQTGNADTALKTLQDENASLKAQMEMLKTEKAKADEAVKAAQGETQKAKDAAAKAAEEAKTAKAAAAAPPTQKAGDLWDLRSAQPDKALISQKGSAVIQSVRPGDSVPGLGTIISIKNDGAAWIVEGTEGRLSR